jgi:hypothetical protein
VRRVPASTICNQLWILAIVVRVVVIVVLLAGPWTDEPAELSGWDAERFQEIAERDAAAWADQPIEYPPGSVVIFDALAGDDVVGTNRSIIVISALAEIAGVVLLWRNVSPRSAKTFAILGLALVPMGYLRLDLLVTVIATCAALALLHRSEQSPDQRSTIAAALFPLLVVAGAMIKLWPALLIVGAFAIGRRQLAIAAAALGALGGVVWLGVVGAGLAPLDQVLSLRGADGWHVESLPGALVALVGSGDARLELNAFRIGTINPLMVTAGRVVAVAVMVLLGLTAARSTGSAIRRCGLVMLGAVAALLVTAPLLSPQFLLWLTPWAALVMARPQSFEPEHRDRLSGRQPVEPVVEPAVMLVAVAVILTGVTLTAFGPQNLTGTVPALLLTLRNLSLLALPVACLAALRSELGER